MSNLTPFDLHVLGTPPAFVLSQDQTLYKLYLNDHSRLNLYRAICHSFKNFLYLPSRVIDLTPFRQVSQLRSGLFSQPLALPSGAFRFVRCLIYKVHVPRGTVIIVADVSHLVNYYFTFFRHFSLTRFTRALPSRTALLDYHTPCRLSTVNSTFCPLGMEGFTSSAQLMYYLRRLPL